MDAYDVADQRSPNAEHIVGARQGADARDSGCASAPAAESDEADADREHARSGRGQYANIENVPGDPRGGELGKLHDGDVEERFADSAEAT